MATQIVVKRNQNESAGNVLRRFTKRYRAANFARSVKSKRYFARAESKLRRKQSALVRMERTKQYARLEKLGKITNER